MELSIDVNYLAILVAAISSFAIGGLWYGPIMGKPWTGFTGITNEKAAEANMARVFGVSFVAQLVAATAIAILLGKSDPVSGALTGILFAVAFVGTSMVVNDQFEQRPTGLTLINVANNVIAYAVMGAIIGAWH